MAPLRCVRPSIRIVDVPAPSIGTPIACRNSHSSTTCGSVAAWRISVTPCGRGGGEHRRLGAGDRRLVEIERGAAQPVGRVQLVARLGRRRARRARPAPARASRSCAASGSRRPEAPGARGRSGRAAAPSAAPTRAGVRPASDRACRSSPSGVEISSVGVPSPLTRAPTPVSRSAITRMSEMRGTFSRRHVSSLSRQAATSGSAEFLLPSTVMRPDSRRPPSMRSVDMVMCGRCGPDQSNSPR